MRRPAARHWQQRNAAGVPAHQLGAERGAGPVVHCRGWHGRAGRSGGNGHCTGHLGGAVRSVRAGKGAHPHPGEKAFRRGQSSLLGAVQPEHLHGPDEQHRVCGFGGAAVRHQRAWHPDHCGAHRCPQAVCLYGYAAHLHGERRFHLRFPEPRRKPARPCAQGNAADVSVLGGGDGRRRGADELWCSVDGAADLRLFGAHRAGKRCAVPAVERTVLCGAGGAAVHPLRAAEPWPEGAAAVLQRDRAGGQGDLCAGVHPEIPVQCGHPVRAHHLVLHDGISGGGVPARALCVPEKEEVKTATVTTELTVRKETLGEKIRNFFKNFFKRK